MSRASSGYSFGGKKSNLSFHTDGGGTAGGGDYLSKEDEYSRLNAELEARTASLLNDAESVLKHNQSLLADDVASKSNTEFGNHSNWNEEQDSFSRDEEGDYDGANKYDYLPSDEDDHLCAGLEQQLTGKQSAIPEINKTKPSSSTNQNKSRPPSSKATSNRDLPKSRQGSSLAQRRGETPTSGLGGARAKKTQNVKSRADLVATPSAALQDTIARYENEEANGDNETYDDGGIGIATELGSVAANRFLKAKLRVLQEELDKMSNEMNKKEQELFKLQQKLKEAEEEKSKCQKQSQGQAAQIDKFKKLVDEWKRKTDSSEAQVVVLKKEVESLKKDTNKNISGKSVTEVRLNRALEEVEKYKIQLTKLNQNSKESLDGERKKMEQLVNENKKLEKQKQELITGFKKQLKLIDMLKRQRMHIEAAKLLQFTEEEFIKALDLGS